MTDERPAGTLGIVELHGACRRLAEAHDVLFRVTGTWVGTTTPAAAQQLFAEACHRHAWHAELWRARTPAIPETDLPVDASAGDTPIVDLDAPDRLRAYRAAVDRLVTDTAAIDARTDPTLDPSTRRVVELTQADLDALGRRAAAIG